MVVDRLEALPATAGRIAEAIATAFQEGEGIAIAVRDGGRLRFTRHPACSACDTPAAMVTPALFSFNNPRGACSTCNGFGATLEYHESLIIPDPERSLADGAIDPWTKPRYETRRRLLLDFAASLGVDRSKPWRKLKAAHRREMLYGKKGRYSASFPFSRDWRRSDTSSTSGSFCVSISSPKPVQRATGTRLNPDALAVRVAGETIGSVAARSVEGIFGWLESLISPAVRAGGRPARPRPAAGETGVPAGRRTRISHPGASDSHSVGRRSATHRPRQRARIAPG